MAEQLAQVRAERDELAVAEQVLERVSEQIASERVSAAPIPRQVGGQSVMLIPHRVEEATLPPDYQRILAAVRQAAMARQVGDVPGVAGQKTANRVLATGRAPVEHGFAHLKNWRILTRLRTDPARATHLLCALLVLTNLEVNR
ncbi:transposase family protein [Streptomyces sp. NPDC014724]|uniref:transposase family protein n=1 Tax=unclassified Streptomyces TaxID=2593676 RepID=UPI0036FFB5DA